MRIYAITPRMLPIAVRDVPDWAGFLKEFYGMRFPRGGFAYYSHHELLIADTEAELDQFAFLFSSTPSPNHALQRTEAGR